MFAFDNSYARLPERFYARVLPAKVREPRLVQLNRPLAQLLGVDPGRLEANGVAEMLAGNAIKFFHLKDTIPDLSDLSCAA